MGIDINSLSPAAKDALLNSLLGSAGGQEQSYSPSPQMGNPDEAADRALIDDQIKGYMEAVTHALEILGTMVQQLQSQVDDLVGGLAGTLDARTRYAIEQESVSKYGEMFSPYADTVREIDGSDLMKELQDAIYDLRQSPDYSEDQETQWVTQAHQALKDKMDRIRGVTAAPVMEGPLEESSESPAEANMELGGEAPASVAVEKTVVAPEGPDMEGIKRTAARLKSSRVTSV